MFYQLIKLQVLNVVLDIINASYFLRVNKALVRHCSN